MILFLAALRALGQLQAGLRAHGLHSARRRRAGRGSSASRSIPSSSRNSRDTQDQYARFGAPVVEELAKAVYWIFLIATARVAFMADSAICGFAVGAGFALVENIYLSSPAQGQRAWDLDLARVWHSHHARRRGGAWSDDFGLSARQPAMAWRASFCAGRAGSDCAPLVVQPEPAVPVASMVAAVVGLPLILGLCFISANSRCGGGWVANWTAISTCST